MLSNQNTSLRKIYLAFPDVFSELIAHRALCQRLEIIGISLDFYQLYILPLNYEIPSVYYNYDKTMSWESFSCDLYFNPCPHVVCSKGYDSYHVST